jgi:anti-sigma regulatory factor (Ser/Thr protein kinase)
LVEVTPYPDRLEITVTDHGYVPPPGLPAPPSAPPHGHDQELRESGLGLFLMQSLMDEVQHQTGEESETVVRLVKYLPEHKIQAEVDARFTS